MEFENNLLAKYADDPTVYAFEENTEEMIVSQKLFTWFSDNQVKANHSKRHLLLSPEPFSIQISGAVINSSQSEKLLGVYFDNKIKISRTCK